MSAHSLRLFFLRACSSWLSGCPPRRPRRLRQPSTGPSRTDSARWFFLALVCTLAPTRQINMPRFFSAPHAQLGGILFSAAVSTRFDADPKRWRMVSAYAMNLSSLLEMVVPLFPSLFVPLAGTLRAALHGLLDPRITLLCVAF
jgi:hypothetical protein